VKGFVLAAGFGQRMRPVTESVPKPLLPIGNLPLIGYALKLLSFHGITDVIVNLHHLRDKLREAVGDGADYGVRITYSEEEEILGTGGGLKKMHEQLQESTFVVVNSDSIVDVDLFAAIEAHKRAGALATMVLRDDPASAEFGQIEVDQSARIRRILGQGAEGGSFRSLMFTGVHVLEPRFLEYIPPDVNTCINRYAYTKALHNDEVLHGFVSTGYFADAGTPARYYQAHVDALEQRIKLRHADPLGGFALSPRREVAEVVRMGTNVELGNNVRLLPPVLLGDGARVGDGATVGPYAVLRPGAHVGKDAAVAHSVVLEGARVDAEARVLRQLVGKKTGLALEDGAAG
jgi:NDP-sugar pyrophosphorylase family protein